jgi:hypothetical protein
MFPLVIPYRDRIALPELVEKCQPRVNLIELGIAVRAMEKEWTDYKKPMDPAAIDRGC